MHVPLCTAATLSSTRTQRALHSARGVAGLTARNTHEGTKEDAHQSLLLITAHVSHTAVHTVLWLKNAYVEVLMCHVAPGPKSGAAAISTRYGKNEGQCEPGCHTGGTGITHLPAACTPAQQATCTEGPAGRHRKAHINKFVIDGNNNLAPHRAHPWFESFHGATCCVTCSGARISVTHS
ncbi:hypothetical protein COO60DRAFT_1562542, partial [Scenedesmus sp. NREL 46B-D3]